MSNETTIEQKRFDYEIVHNEKALRMSCLDMALQLEMSLKKVSPATAEDVIKSAEKFKAFVEKF